MKKRVIAYLLLVVHSYFSGSENKQTFKQVKLATEEEINTSVEFLIAASKCAVKPIDSKNIALILHDHGLEECQTWNHSHPMYNLEPVKFKYSDDNKNQSKYHVLYEDINPEELDQIQKQLKVELLYQKIKTVQLGNQQEQK